MMLPAEVLAVASAFPPAAVPEEFWSLLLRRCAHASRLVGPAETAGLLVGLAYLPPLPGAFRTELPLLSCLISRVLGALESPL